MRRLVVSSIGALIIAASAASAASAGEHLLPGTPGLPNCHGQTAAWLAQVAKTFGLEKALRGLGQLARVGDFDVSQLQDSIRIYCAEGGGS